jgi:hypothetical protein
VAALLGLAVAGGTTGLAALSPRVAVSAPTAVLASGAVEVAPVDVRALRQEAELLRASRDRGPAPVPAPAVPPPPPAPEPPPAPVLPGCEGAPATGYANGRIPSSALCRLPGSRGHALRADAARAFAQLSAAYEAERGKPLCLTDSYRSYEAQVKLRWAKRGLAAPPGTSNHGSGIAVDMCGGVESFGTAAHRWMKENAGRFGWVHPSWAGPRGKRPEPWHWEYRP